MLHRCGHCKKLAPEYEVAATALISNDPPIPIAKVDCPANTQLCSQFGVSGYPTLKIFRDGKLSADYQGPRNAGKQCDVPTFIWGWSCKHLRTCRWNNCLHEEAIRP